MAMSGCAARFPVSAGAHSSGHCYFALKDEGAKIDAVVWKFAHARMRFKPQEGLEVIATGKLTTFPGKSSYQIVIESLEPAGVGALMALLEERKKKLAAEGLFDAARKQELPWLPEVIGVVTSPTGAVIRDILHRLQDRFPRRVLVWPVKVQGEGSAEQVAAAIRGFNALPEGGRIPRPDLLIVARGGGSLEDLWSFNEEIVVRAAADSMIPLISAVGHETDITLIDFAADKRAPTPTAAAEMAVPVRSELFVEVSTLARRTMVCWQRGQEARRNELRAAARALPAANELLAIPRQRLDSAGGALPRGLRANTHAHFRRFAASSAQLTVRRAARPGRVTRASASTIVGERLTHCGARSLLHRRRDRFAGLESAAEGLKARQRGGAARRRSRARAIACIACRTAPPAPSTRCWSGSMRRWPIAANCSRRSPIAACSRAALRWCATMKVIRCTVRPRWARMRACRSNSPTAMSASPRMPIALRLPRCRQARPDRQRAKRGDDARPNRPIKAICFRRELPSPSPGGGGSIRIEAQRNARAEWGDGLSTRDGARVERLHPTPFRISLRFMRTDPPRSRGG